MMVDPALAREARVLRLRLELGLVEIEQIEQWADAAIVRLDAPSNYFSVVCLAQREGTAASGGALEGIGGGVTAIDVVAALATLDATGLPIHRAKELAKALVGWAVQLNEDSDAGRVLLQAYGLYDEFNVPPSVSYAPDVKPYGRCS